MNELIKRLADEVRFTSELPYPDQDTIFQRFAELIVKECADVSKNYAGGSMPLSISLAIKEHFGVK